MRAKLAQLLSVGMREGREGKEGMKACRTGMYYLHRGEKSGRQGKKGQKRAYIYVEHNAFV